MKKMTEIILLRISMVLLMLQTAIPLLAEEPSVGEKKESEVQLTMPSEMPEVDQEKLISELEKILEETVREALKEQKEELKVQFEKENRRLTSSRSFWRKTAIIEGAVILGAGLVTFNFFCK